jgi:Plasmid encoded RepA protein
MRAWLVNMGLSIGGTTYRLINEQAKRISGCRLTFFADRTGHEIRSQGGFVKTAIPMAAVLGDQPERLWQDAVLLDEDFYRALCDHPVPLSESALRAIGPRSMTIDVYVWLAYRLLTRSGRYGRRLARPIRAVRGRIQSSPAVPRPIHRMP